MHKGFPFACIQGGSSIITNIIIPLTYWWKTKRTTGWTWKGCVYSRCNFLGGLKTCITGKKNWPNSNSNCPLQSLIIWKKEKEKKPNCEWRRRHEQSKSKQAQSPKHWGKINNPPSPWLKKVKNSQKCKKQG